MARTPLKTADELRPGDIILCLKDGRLSKQGTLYRVTDVLTKSSFRIGTLETGELPPGFTSGNVDEAQRFALVGKVPQSRADYQIGDIVQCLKSGTITQQGERYRVIPALKGDGINLGDLETGKSIFDPGQQLGMKNAERNRSRFVIVEKAALQEPQPPTGGSSMTVSAELDAIRNDLGEERRNVRRITERFEEKLESLLTEVRAMETRMTPDEMRGVIRNYRYGMNRDQLTAPGRSGKAITHSFDLEIGSQIWLHIVLGVKEWEPFIEAQADKMEEGDDIGQAKFWNGKHLTVRRNKELDRFVPVNLLGDPLGTDRNGAPVFRGDRVRLLDGTSTNAEVRGLNGAYYEVRRDDGAEGGASFDEEYDGGKALWSVATSSVELLTGRTADEPF